MGADESGVEKDFLEVRVLGQLREDAMPDPAIGPTCKAFVHAVPGTEARRNIPPRRAGASDPQHRLDEQGVVLGRDPNVRGLAGQHALDASVRVIAQYLPGHGPNSVNELER